MRYIIKIFGYFPENRARFIKYSLMSIIVGLLELFGVALTYPFVMGILQKGNINSKSVLFSIFLGITIIILFLVKNIIMIFYSKVQAQISKLLEKEINLKFMNYFISNSYLKTSKISLAEKQNMFNLIIPNVTNNYILRLQHLNVNFIIFLLLLLFLIIKFPIATFVTILCAGILLYTQNKFFNPKMQALTIERNKASKVFHQKINEALINLKSVKISNNEKFFFEGYKKAISRCFESDAEATYLSLIPPYITEPMIIVLLFILLAIIMFQNYTNPQKLIASFAVIVSAIFRIAPTLSRIQVNLNGIYSAIPFVKELINFYEMNNIANQKEIESYNYSEFKDSIELKNVNFEYEENQKILNNINLKINKGEFIGIAGLSGAGKSTLADIISGLLSPSEGDIIIDGSTERKRIKIGYIPQEINIISGSIKDNVVYGNSVCDEERVIQVLKDAKLYDFVLEHMNGDINSNYFVDSIGFSQGQKQRIAIARCLYMNPDVLILDEATSSLDLKTEDDICKLLSSLKGDKTLIVIAHRLTTIKSADRIIYLQNNTIADIASFDELVNRNSEFKSLVELNNIKDI